MRGIIRERYSDFLARHEIAWELAFAALAIAFVAIGFAPEDEAWVEAVEWAMTGVFLAEFASRLWAAQSRSAYVRGHWIDLLAIVPPVRGLRVLRLLRLVRLVRAFTGVARAVSSVERLARHRGLIWVLAGWCGVMVITSVGLYAAEHGANAAVASPLDALWWGIVTMTTVGYGDVYPITPEGRLFAAALMILGIGLFAAVTATITSFLVADSASDVPAEIAKLAALHADGVLTDDEFAVAKARLLDRL